MTDLVHLDEDHTVERRRVDEEGGVRDGDYRVVRGMLSLTILGTLCRCSPTIYLVGPTKTLAIHCGSVRVRCLGSCMKAPEIQRCRRCMRCCQSPPYGCTEAQITAGGNGRILGPTSNCLLPRRYRLPSMLSLLWPTSSAVFLPRHQQTASGNTARSSTTSVGVRHSRSGLRCSWPNFFETKALYGTFALIPNADLY